jgi:hypothetical protein
MKQKYSFTQSRIKTLAGASLKPCLKSGSLKLSTTTRKIIVEVNHNFRKSFFVYAYGTRTTLGELLSYLEDALEERLYFRTKERNICVDHLLSFSDYLLIRLRVTVLKLHGFKLSAPQRQLSLVNFDVLRQIGVGGFSKVFLLQARFNSKFYALKAIDKA